VAQQSILTTTKKILGLPEEDTSFDLDIMVHINSVLDVLNQLGIGPEEGFVIEDASATWGDFLGETMGSNRKVMHSVKTYVYLRVKIIFDPPATSFAMDAMNKQIDEIGWRLNVMREEEAWVDPTLPVG
jgi:hypothetical protein